MKKSLFLLTLLLLCAAVSFSLAEGAVVRVTSSSAANLRASADSDSARVGRASPGDTFPYLGTTANGWYEVQLEDGQHAFISGKLAELVGAADAPALQAQPEAASAENAQPAAEPQAEPEAPEPMLLYAIARAAADAKTPEEREVHKYVSGGVVDEVSAERLIVRTGKHSSSMRFGMIDFDGNVIVPCEWYSISGFDSDLLTVKHVEGKEGFINYDGELVIPCEWDDASFFCDGLAQVRNDSTGVYGFINTSGQLAISLECDYANNFRKGFAQIKKDGKYGYINTAGNFVVPCEYDTVSFGFEPEMFRVENNGKFGFYSPEGELVVPCEWDDAGHFNEGLGCVTKKGKKGFVNTAGELVIPCEWDDAESFREGLAWVKKNGKYGFINTAGELVIPCEWDSAEFFSEGLARVEKKGKFGFINTSGELVVPCEWDYAFHFNNGLAPVDRDEKMGYIDTTGKLVIPCQWDYAGIFDEYGVAQVQFGKRTMYNGRLTAMAGNKYAYINREGRLLTLPGASGGYRQGLFSFTLEGYYPEEKWMNYISVVDCEGNVVF